ncbi:MAG: alpha/beta hydrolase [Gracilimonas sp.]|uniref:alpha/beta hydrolase n=1 Tax=Gracilimonas sp. TaxID=1974203 RepID=UPI0019ABF5DD|nr:alpha/beta hydrolase [Gracilimonas sp.]MBD3616221.1 alpha/beta hydrolase [Gracilimonas sp.]
MSKLIIFIQGGGAGGYDADARLVDSLQTALGETYEVRYPQMFSDETQPDFGWPHQIGKEISGIKGKVILAGHSLGASMVLKFLSEHEIREQIDSIFLIATPFWSGDEDWIKGLKLQVNFEDHLPKEVPIFFYHCRDDEEVPFEHLSIYSQKLPWATFREIPSGGHQFNNDLTLVAKDIKSL